MANSDDLGTGLVAYGWVFFAMSFMVVMGRVFTRVVYLKDRMQLHDILMVLALFFEVFHISFLTVARTHGLGHHIEVLTADQDHAIGHWNVVIESFSVIVSYFGRMSFSVFLLTVLGKTAKPQRIVLWVLIVSDTIINVFVVIQIYAQCGKDLSAQWNPAVAAVAHCQAADFETYLGYVQASWNSLCDLVLTLLPVTIITKLKMPTSTKIGLASLLTLSFFAFVASVAKAVEIRQLSNGTDFTYNFCLLQLCVVSENNIVMIAASIPMLRALFTKDKSSSSYPHASTRGQTTANTAAQRTRNGTHATATKLGDDDEEHMLSDIKEGGITRTVGTVVTTTFADGSQVEKAPDVTVQSRSDSW